MYNNPYIYQSLYKPSLISKLFGGGLGKAGTGLNWNTILSNTQKSLGIINQAIPLVYQVKPIISNAKTMFKIAGALKEEPILQKKEQKTKNKEINKNENKPIFYI